MSIFRKGNTSACVSCTVSNCIHHSIANCCTAEHIEVCGPSASSDKDTVCRTFCKKDSTSMV